jgi:PAS domain S-box-containing protein
MDFAPSGAATDTHSLERTNNLNNLLKAAPGNSGLKQPMRIILGSLLALLCLSGYVSNLTLFNSISFVFGSIAALIALQILGLRWGVATAAIGASYTIFAWGHSVAVIVFTLEVVIVSAFARRTGHLAIADGLFWVFIGGPIVFLLYTVYVGTDLDTSAFIALKQSINGVFNAVVASMLLTILRQLFPAFRSNIPAGSFASMIFQVMALVSIGLAATLVVLESRSLYARSLGTVASSMYTVALLVREEYDNGTPSQIGPLIERTIVPVLDRVDGRVDAARDIAIAAVLEDGSLRNIFGTVNSGNGAVTLKETRTGLLKWSPSGDMPEMQRSRNSRYVLRLDVEAIPELRQVLVEFSAAAHIDELEAEGRRNLVILSLAVLAILFVSRIVAQWLSNPLRRITRDGEIIIDQIIRGKPYHPLPTGEMTDYRRLTDTINEASGRLAAAFADLNGLTRTLEAKVKERTSDLALMSQVARQTKSAVVITDAAGRTTWVNDAFIRMTGYDLEDLRGKTPGSLLQRTPPSDTDAATMRNGLMQMEGFSVELFNHSKDGTAYWVAIECTPLVDEHGVHTGFIAIETDITERRRAAEELSKSVARLNLATAAAQLGVWSFDAESGQLQWNDRNHELHGTINSREDLMDEWLSLLPTADAERLRAMFRGEAPKGNR